MTHRAELRVIVREALRAQARFAAFTTCPGWSQAFDDEVLPAFGVSTLSEQSRAADKESLSRTIDLTVLIKRKGGDTIEDDLDDDAAAVEEVIASVVEDHSLYAELAETRIILAGDGARRMAALMLRFAVTLHTVNPSY